MKKDGILMAEYRKVFAEVVGAAARQDFKERHICIPSLVIALAAEEADWGNIPEFVLRGELFPYRRDGSRDRYKTISGAVRSHNSYLLTWREKGQLLPNWKELVGQKHYILAVQYLQGAEYPYRPFLGYERRLIEIIESNKLHRFDEF